MTTVQPAAKEAQVINISYVFHKGTMKGREDSNSHEKQQLLRRASDKRLVDRVLKILEFV